MGEILPNIDAFIDACKSFDGTVEKEELADGNVHICKTSKFQMELCIYKNEPNEFTLTTISRPITVIRILEPNISLDKKENELNVESFDQNLKIKISKRIIEVWDDRDAYLKELKNRY
ncbi:MAG: hypothetical protein DRN95_02705 [Candidatus Hydrothermarchaeota archaeon]|nr:MAG: hypothetical protein DRN95_02705 [Candidatus Hydrothermarchaeota archaeon]